MSRTDYGLPGIYNASPITLSSGRGSALAVNINGQLIAAAPSGASANQVQGTAADNAAAVGNPVYMGGIYNSGVQTYGNGDVAALQTDINGNLKVTLGTALSSGTDSVAIGDSLNTANILKSDGTAAGQNAQLMAGTGYTTATLTLNSGTPATGWYDMLNYAAVSVEILTNTTPATLTFQTTGDAAFTNIVSMYMNQAANDPATTTTSATGTYFGARNGRYFRISSNNGAGTTTLVITFYTHAAWVNRLFASQTGTWNVGLSAGTNNVGTVQQAKSDVAVAVSASVTVVKNAAGYLGGVLVTTAGTAQAMTIYDNASAASGTVIGIIPAGATAGQYFPFNMPSANGITCSGSANNPAVTVAYS